MVMTRHHKTREVTVSRIALCAAIACVTFTWFSQQLLYHSDLWGHLSYGRLICEQATLPTTEPFMPLASSVSFKATAWLSQVLGYVAYSTDGPRALQFLYAAAIAACCGAVAATAHRRTQSAPWSIVAVVVFLLVARSQVRIIRPQVAGLLCYTVLLWLIDSKPLTRRSFGCVVLLFVFWANLHPSFPAGLILIAIYGAGHALNVLRRTRKLDWALTHKRVKWFATLLAACSFAVLMNPYGYELYLEVLRVSSNPNLAALLDWQPLTLGSRQGATALIGAVLVGVLLVRTPRRLDATELVGLAVAGLAASFSSRMINWWAPLAGISIAIHGHAAARQVSVWQPRRSAWNATCALVAVCGLLALIRFETAPPGGKAALATSTPVEVGQIAVAAAKGGLIFCPNTWGDYLLWISDGRAKVFATSHVHLIPRNVWEDYLTVSRAKPGAISKLDEYGVSVVLVGRRRKSLEDLLHGSRGWELKAMTPRGKVFVRMIGEPSIDSHDE